MTAFLGIGWGILAVFFWLTVLILGRMPRPVFEATAAVVRYTMRAYAYFMMLTSAYPKWLFDDRALVSAEYPEVPAMGDTRRPRQTQTGSSRCRRVAAAPARSYSPPAVGRY
jgi:hypothetical protein